MFTQIYEEVIPNLTAAHVFFSNGWEEKSHQGTEMPPTWKGMIFCVTVTVFLKIHTLPEV